MVFEKIRGPRRPSSEHAEVLVEQDDVSGVCLLWFRFDGDADVGGGCECVVHAVPRKRTSAPMVRCTRTIRLHLGPSRATRSSLMRRAAGIVHALDRVARQRTRHLDAEFAHTAIATARCRR
jgi:hypothetical protein